MRSDESEAAENISGAPGESRMHARCYFAARLQSSDTDRQRPSGSTSRKQNKTEKSDVETHLL